MRQLASGSLQDSDRVRGSVGSSKLEATQVDSTEVGLAGGAGGSHRRDGVCPSESGAVYCRAARSGPARSGAAHADAARRGGVRCRRHRRVFSESDVGRAQRCLQRHGRRRRGRHGVPEPGLSLHGNGARARVFLILLRPWRLGAIRRLLRVCGAERVSCRR